MAKVTQSLLIGVVALSLGYFLGQKNATDKPITESPQTLESSPPSETAPTPIYSSEIETPHSSIGTKEWDLSSFTEEERKNKCLESLGAFNVPLLPAPELDSKLPRPFVTNFEGELLLRWKPIPKAKSYVVLVENDEGEIVKTYKTTTTLLYLKSLPRDKNKDLQYTFRLATQNLNELIGVLGSKHNLTVKKPLDLTAPKIEEIRIEN